MDEQKDMNGVGVACGVVGVVERVCVEPRSVGNTGLGWISNGTFVCQGDSAGLSMSGVKTFLVEFLET